MELLPELHTINVRISAFSQNVSKHDIYQRERSTVVQLYHVNLGQSVIAEMFGIATDRITYDVISVFN